MVTGDRPVHKEPVPGHSRYRRVPARLSAAGRRPALVVRRRRYYRRTCLKLDVVGGIENLHSEAMSASGFVGRYEQQAGVGQPSFEKLFVGRFVENA